MDPRRSRGDPRNLPPHGHQQERSKCLKNAGKVWWRIERSEPEANPSAISKLLISRDLAFPQSPSTPRIWH